MSEKRLMVNIFLQYFFFFVICSNTNWTQSLMKLAPRGLWYLTTLERGARRDRLTWTSSGRRVGLSTQLKEEEEEEGIGGVVDKDISEENNVSGTTGSVPPSKGVGGDLDLYVSDRNWRSEILVAENLDKLSCRGRTAGGVGNIWMDLVWMRPLESG